jgi:hypothetical protein
MPKVNATPRLEAREFFLFYVLYLASRANILWLGNT